MDEQTKLILALMQVENLFCLLKENEYETFLYSKLHKMKYEIQRQLTNNKTSSKMKEQTTN